MLHTNRSDYRFKFYMAGIAGILRFSPVTLTLTRWPYMKMTRIPSSCTRRPKLNFLYVKAFDSYRITDTGLHTDRRTDRCHRNYYHAALRTCGKNRNHKMWSC